MGLRPPFRLTRSFPVTRHTPLTILDGLLRLLDRLDERGKGSAASEEAGGANA
jgi:hypothetical protein